MTNPGDSFQNPDTSHLPPEHGDPLRNLSALSSRMDSLHHFLSHTLTTNTPIAQPHLDFVSAEISSALRHVIFNASALLASASVYPNLATFPISSPNLGIIPISNPHLGAIPISNPELGKIPISSNPNLGIFPISNPDLGKNPISSNLNLGIVPISNPNLVDFTSLGDAKLETVDLTGNRPFDMKLEAKNDIFVNDWDIIELDSVELLAEHAHFCDICGKGFKRDANLRMHMRAHGNQFKTPEALAKPAEIKPSLEISKFSDNTRFSCPYSGCNRNKKHKKFKPLKSVICVKNHFKRSHCPKTYSCDRCNKKSFSVLADLKSHLKHCGEAKWKCSCGTTFSRKDKLFGHMALFEGHMPAVGEEEEEREKAPVVVIDDDDEDDDRNMECEKGDSFSNNGLFDGLLGFSDTINGYNLQDVMGIGSPISFGTSF